jgi:hypothetical protein
MFLIEQAEIGTVIEVKEMAAHCDREISACQRVIWRYTVVEAGQSIILKWCVARETRVLVEN